MSRDFSPTGDARETVCPRCQQTRWITPYRLVLVPGITEVQPDLCDPCWVHVAQQVIDEVTRQGEELGGS